MATAVTTRTAVDEIKDEWTAMTALKDKKARAGRPRAAEACRFLGALEGREAFDVRYAGCGADWMAENPGWREAALRDGLGRLCEAIGRDLADAEAAAYSVAFCDELGGPGPRSAVEGFREPRNVGELAAALRVFMLDAFGLAPINLMLPDAVAADFMIDDEGQEAVVAVLPSPAWDEIKSVAERAVRAHIERCGEGYTLQWSEA